MSGRREAMLLLAACLVAYTTGIGDLAFYTRGEPREGLVVREMVRTGDWLVPARPEGEVARKPPLYYWLAAPLLHAMPDSPELALRLPSAALATAAVLGTWALARAVSGPAAALPAALVLATAFEWVRAATSARIDMTLAAALTGVLAAWMLVLAGRDRRWLAVAAAGAALGTLAKGPVALALPAFAAAALVLWERDAAVVRRLGVLPVLGAAALCAGLWYAVAFAEQGRAFFDVVVKENVVRFIDTDDAGTGHGHGLFYLPIVGLVGLLPWAPALPLVGPPLRGPRAEPLRLAACWAATVLVFFSLAHAKRSVYLLPAFPALALLIGAGAAEAPSRLARGLAAVYAPALALLGVLGLALATGVDPAALLQRWLKPDDARGAAAVASAARSHGALVASLAAATIAGAVAIERARRAGAFRRLVLLAGALVVGWVALFDGVIHPAVARTRSLATFMARVDRLVPADAALHVILPADPGLRFYAPRPLVRLHPEASAEARWMLVWEDEWRHWRDAHGQPLRPLATSEGRQSRHGSVILVLAEPGGLRRARGAAQPARDPGLWNPPRP